MHRTRLLGLALAVAAATAVVPGAAAAADAAPGGCALDIGTSENVRPAPPSGIIAILIGLREAPPRSFAGDAYDNEMG
jgi:hypothetical protein